MSNSEAFLRRTKIVGTLGPATDDPGVLADMVRAGLDVARINFSHGGKDEQRRRIHAVRAAAEWFKKVEIRDKAYRRTDDGRNLVDSPGASPLWSRYYNLVDHQPIFGDRDKSIHDTIGEISRERRDGYAWFTDAPESVLKQFELWNAKR